MSCLSFGFRRAKACFLSDTRSYLVFLRCHIRKVCFQKQSALVPPYYTVSAIIAVHSSTAAPEEMLSEYEKPFADQIAKV